MIMNPAMRTSIGRSTYSRINAAVVAAILFAILEAIAVFNDGGYYLGGMTFSVIGAWLLLIFLVAASSRENKIEFSRSAIVVIILFFLFWVWTSASTSWSIASDLSLVEASRSSGYLALLVLGILLGRNRSARWLVAFLFLLIATAAALNTIGAKAFPLAIENYKNAARVFPPLGYTNASGLMAAFAIPLALFFSAERSHHPAWRILASISAVLLPVAVIYTQSRGAILALIFGLLIYFLLSPIRTRSLIMLVSITVPAIAILVWSSGQAAFTQNNADIGVRLAFAESLRWYIAASVTAVVLATLLMIIIDWKVTFAARTVRVTGAVILLLTIAALSISVTLFVQTREPTFTEWTHNFYSQFTSLDRAGPSDFGHLSSISSSGRWQVWKEAIESWQESPIYGRGAQSFPLTHLMKREPAIGFMKQPHGIMFRLLSELGITGLLLFSIFLVMTMTLATLLIQSLRGQRQLKGLAVAMLSMTTIYLVHTSYEWDWNMFAVTMPYFLFTGIMTGWYGSVRTSQAQPK